jgi:hypothetical protein
MVPMDAWRPTRPVDLSASPRTRHDTDLDRLIDIATATDKVIVINDAEGNDIGVVDQVTLLKGIQGGKA